MEDKIKDIDQRLKSLENLHKYAFITIIALGGLILILKK